MELQMEGTSRGGEELGKGKKEKDSRERCEKGVSEGK